MSFSGEVKEELSRQVAASRHCCVAELAAIINCCGEIVYKRSGAYCLKVHTENLTVARKYFILIRKTFQVKTEILVKRNVSLKKSKNYFIYIRSQQDVDKVLKAAKLLKEDGQLRKELLPSHLVTQNTCCKRAFIRGIFLAGGSITNPSKTYHFEIVAGSETKALYIAKIMQSFEIDAKIIPRKKYFVVYVKEGAQIVDLLNIMEAHIALMNLENVRILKEMRNSINRQVNCETANINKTVVAATKQIDDILYIRNMVGLSELSEGLEEVARLRIEQPDASLKELGALLNPPLGKSGVNHRLRRISKIADSLREQKEE